MRRVIDRLLSLGYTDALPQRMARHVRVVNGLALVGLVLSLTSVPLDAFEAPLATVINDVLSALGFAGVLVIQRHRHRKLARLVLIVVGNVSILHGVITVGAAPELRTVFLPLVMMPFLVVDMSERGWLAAFVAVPVGEYFLTGAFASPGTGVARAVYEYYAPLLSFTMMVAGSLVFAYVDRNADERVLKVHERAAQNARMVALGEMSSGIAHEIKNPLAAIHLAATQVVAFPSATNQVAALGERIQRIVMRASRIIDALRSFSREASGDPFEPAPVERIVSDTLELCGKRFSENGIDLTVAEVPPEIVVVCRHVQLAQVLVNLLGNAFDAAASMEERWVKIDVHVDGAHLVIAVTDSGAGIPTTARLRIFEPFYTTKAPDRGTGIGLSLSRGIVQAHHGTLELDQASPCTRFVMRIPLVQPRVGAAT